MYASAIRSSVTRASRSSARSSRRATPAGFDSRTAPASWRGRLRAAMPATSWWNPKMPKANARHQRIEAQMQRSLAVMLPRAVKDPRVGYVTVTAVKLAADSGSAKIYVLPFGDRHAPDEVLAG